MRLEDIILCRLDELLEMGQALLNLKSEPEPNDVCKKQACADLEARWVTSIQEFFSSVFGRENVYLQSIINLAEGNIDYIAVQKIQEVLASARDDLEGSLLFELRTSIESEVFENFIEHAEQLLNIGLCVPSAVILGCVFEDVQRNLCSIYHIETAQGLRFDRMDSVLSKVNLCNKLTQEQVAAFKDLKNKAACGRWEEFTPEDVRLFIEGIKAFLSYYMQQD